MEWETRATQSTSTIAERLTDRELQQWWRHDDELEVKSLWLPQKVSVFSDPSYGFKYQASPRFIWRRRRQTSEIFPCWTFLLFVLFYLEEYGGNCECSKSEEDEHHHSNHSSVKKKKRRGRRKQVTRSFPGIRFRSLLAFFPSLLVLHSLLLLLQISSIYFFTSPSFSFCFSFLSLPLSLPIESSIERWELWRRSALIARKFRICTRVHYHSNDPVGVPKTHALRIGKVLQYYFICWYTSEIISEW